MTKQLAVRTFLAIFVAIIIIGGTGYAVVRVVEVGNQSKITAVEAKNAATDALHFAHKLQGVRLGNIRQNCVDQNRRNTKTIKALNKTLAPAFATKDPVIIAQVKAQKKSALTIINSAIPYQNCQKLVEQDSVQKKGTS